MDVEEWLDSSAAGIECLLYISDVLLYLSQSSVSPGTMSWRNIFMVTAPLSPVI